MENLVQQQLQNQSEYQNNSISIHLTRRRREHDDDDDDDDDDDGLNILGKLNEKQKKQLVPITPSVVGPRPKRRWNSCPTSHAKREIHVSPATVDQISLTKICFWSKYLYLRSSWNKKQVYLTSISNKLDLKGIVPCKLPSNNSVERCGLPCTKPCCDDGRDVMPRPQRFAHRVETQ